ncbi:beta-N-acetylhexosaminidase [Amycolatopsis thermophila]|uniref:beta-N-acetylhexosaminidase n=1 Tax=Amycolatopsis thermophila TaxID=206084 RepID=A0ABU0EVW2_9PSEU|nr:beta-N-acetylhexosaminidase [Amycolatopsis thermophila]MDQ0379101.1 hexosaminidase [Amycolatopsis thermophila]
MRRFLTGLLGATALALTALTQPAAASQPATRALADVIPAPVSAKVDPKADFRLTPSTAIEAGRGARQVADYLAGVLRPSTGYRLPVVERTKAPSIALELRATAQVGDQGYQLTVARGGVTLRANTSDGLFAGVQTLRQLLPARVESQRVQRGPWTLPGGTITDYPRFPHRGAMLDVARHFFSVDEVKRYMDQIAQYKINRLHLHLADDQGWRIEIKSWPRLATYGGSTEVGGGPGGYYTQEQYTDLVAYAASRHITVIPEIDMPGHTNAALASYPELNCDGVAPPLYTGIEVGFSSFCVDKDITYKFLDDVIGELAALTPGEYLHIGGDEAHATTPEDYQKFTGEVLSIVARHGKLAQGWHEIAKANPPVSAVPQFWDTDGVDAATAAAAAAGNKIVMSPANKAYLDMQYNENSPLGLHWAGYVEVADSYDWDPATAVQGVGESSVAGVEAPLWSETLTDSDDIEFMAFPRLPGIAEIGWSPKSTHDWTAYRERLAQQAPRWEAQGIDFYRSPQVDWP